MEGKTAECGLNEEKMGVGLNDEGKSGVTCNAALRQVQSHPEDGAVPHSPLSGPAYHSLPFPSP